MAFLEREARKIAAAIGIAVAAVLLVVAFVAGQRPEPEADPPLRAPTLPASEAPRGQPRSPAPAPKEPSLPPETATADPASETPTAGGPERSRAASAPEKPEPEPSASTEPGPATKPGRKSTPPPRERPRSPPPPAPRRPSGRPPVEVRSTRRTMIAPARPRGDGFKVKFRSLAVLEALVGTDQVAIVIEYPDGNRFLLPRDLDGELVTLEIPEGRFDAWVADRRVSELEPTPQLLDRLGVHTRGVRYLAVLSETIRDAIGREAERARVHVGRSVMVIDADQGQPEVSVLLARR